VPGPVQVKTEAFQKQNKQPIEQTMRIFTVFFTIVTLLASTQAAVITCTGPGTCPDNQECVKSLQFPGFCYPPAKLGEGCQNAAPHCEEGLYCSRNDFMSSHTAYGVCVKRAGLGEDCGGSRPIVERPTACVSGLTCEHHSRIVGSAGSCEAEILT